MKQNPYLPIAATIDQIVDETPTIKTFGLRPAEPIAFQAGQFVELLVPGIGEAPFTPSSSPLISERMEITIMRVGRVTDALHEMFALFEDLDHYPGILVRIGARSPHDMVFRDAASNRWNKGEKE